MRFLLFSLAICMTFSFCKKEENTVEPYIPTTPIDTTDARVTLNGILVDYKPSIQIIGHAYSPDTFAIWQFSKVKGIYRNNLAPFYVDNLGKTGLLTRQFFFTQIHGHDQDNHIYEQVEQDSAYFILDEYDRENLFMAGRFRAKFHRKYTGVMNDDTYLPEILLYEGSFHTNYY